MNGLGGIDACTQCSLTDLEYHDLYYHNSHIDLGKRIDALCAPYKKHYASPVWGSAAVWVLAICTVGWHQYTYNPDGFIMRQYATVMTGSPLYTAAQTGQRQL